MNARVTKFDLAMQALDAAMGDNEVDKGTRLAQLEQFKENVEQRTKALKEQMSAEDKEQKKAEKQAA